MHIVHTRLGQPAHRQLLVPQATDPLPEIWADAKIDMRTAVADPHRDWWIAARDGRPLAWCAAWPIDGGARIECGCGYELGHRGRAERYYPVVFAARQQWLAEQGLPAVTWVHDQPIALHLAAGWTRAKPYDPGDINEDRQHWQELRWTA